MCSKCPIYKSNPQRLDAAVNIITIFGVQAQTGNVIELYMPKFTGQVWRA